MPISDVLRDVFARPGEYLLRRWNWKSALFSSILRALIFLIANARAGWRAAAGATIVEFLFRAATSGFFGSLTQALRAAEPAWAAVLALMVGVPLLAHALELLIHLAMGTPSLARSMIASMIFTEVAVLFNLYVMRRGAFVVGETSTSFMSDLRRIPSLIGGFVAAGPLALYRLAFRREQI